MLELQNVTIKAKERELLHDITLFLSKGEAIGITGQSGSGKTTILRCIMGILGGSCVITNGSIRLDGRRIDNMPMAKRRRLNGTTLGFIPQNPMTAFDTRIKIGQQLIETFTLRLGISRKEAFSLIDQVLKDLNLVEVERIKNCLPSELSGGMLQRIVVAVLLGLKPDYILADEPTSALDADNTSILLKQLKKKNNSAGILFVSHDIEAINTLCENLYVMKNGKIIESGKTADILENPVSGWTKQFIAAYQKPKEETFTWRRL